MQKKIFLVLFVILIPLVILGILIYKNQSTTPTKSSALEITTPTPSEVESLIQVGGFKVAWYETDNLDSLKLIANFDEKKTSGDVIDQNKCRFLSNAGFYSTDSKPLGLFISDGNVVKEFVENALFDGIVSVNDMTTPRITRSEPEDHLKVALQTGPIIKENGSFLTLKIQNDSPARRVMAAITGTNKLIFLTAYRADSEYMGPTLTELPQLMKEFESKSRINFADIINLDGGAASTFNTPNLKLSEINPVGAFFCQL